MVENRRPLRVTLMEQPRQAGRFTFSQWRLDSLTPGQGNEGELWLQLALTERAAYRHNLSAALPRLFVRAGFSGDRPVPEAVTASQEVAASWMDGEQQVFDTCMPMAIQVWIESYMARHGEAAPEGRKKKRKGAGRASGEQSPKDPTAGQTNS